MNGTSSKNKMGRSGAEPMSLSSASGELSSTSFISLFWFVQFVAPCRVSVAMISLKRSDTSEKIEHKKYPGWAILHSLSFASITHA